MAENKSKSKVLFQNEAFVGGIVTKVQKSDKRQLCRVFVNLPTANADDEGRAGQSAEMPVDIVGKHYELAKTIKEGDFFACAAWLVSLKRDADGKDKKFTVRVLQALESRPLTIIPDGGKYAKAAFNNVTFQGRCTRKGELKETQKGKKMIATSVLFMPRLDKNATEEEKTNAGVFVDIWSFGGQAEKFVDKYLNEGDNVLATGMLQYDKENWTSGGKDVFSFRINTRDLNFVTTVSSDGGGPRDKAKTDVYKESGGDEDLPF